MARKNKDKNKIVTGGDMVWKGFVREMFFLDMGTLALLREMLQRSLEWGYTDRAGKDRERYEAQLELTRKWRKEIQLINERGW